MFLAHACIRAVLVPFTLVSLLAATRPAVAQGTPREVRLQVNQKLARGEFLDAIPDLQQLIAWLGDSEKPYIKTNMEFIHYQLGICHFFVGQFAEARQALANYLKKYRHGAKRKQASLYIADAQRFGGNLEQALRTYAQILRKYEYTPDLKADIYSSMARCHLAADKWRDATGPLKKVYAIAPDFMRRSWAATLLTTAYFKDLDLDSVYPLVPYILRPNSFASRSVAFNLAALEAGDELFAVERYRDALWVFRMVYPHDQVIMSSDEYLEWLQQRAKRLRERPADPRLLMRLQEGIGELEEEIKAMRSVDNYDLELLFRIARGYMEMLRYREARDLFVYLHDEAQETEAEEALSLAFQCSAQILPWDQAFKLGEQYMEKYAAGEYFDYITLAMGQMYARLQDWPEVIRHLSATLEMRPQHDSGAECMFLIGYASFMEEKFANAVTWLRRMNKMYPDSELAPDASYWTGMSLLFQTEYKHAAVEFDQVIEDFSSNIYAEDSTFRRAVCAYGMGVYADCDKRLTAFVKRYPQSKLFSEALMMRGDVAGAVGKLKEAVSFYRQAMTDQKINIEFYNHCAFQAGRILADEPDYPALISHFKDYIKEKREGCNIPQAVYWVGVALWNNGQREGALRYYRRAVEAYGKDPAKIGVDMILDEWVGRIRRSVPDAAGRAWGELQTSLDTALQTANKTMELRIKRILLLNPRITGTDKQRIANQFLSAPNIEPASPAVLQTMLGLAKERDKRDFAVKVARHIIARFTETDYALDARMILAEFAIENAGTARNRREADKHYADAIMHLGVVRTVFASSGEAGKALIILGGLYSKQKKYDQADECYKSVLGVKGWRNLWPEALHGRGEAAYAQRKFDVASAYYERIYLMYSHYAGWTAKAYVRRAECLHRLYQDHKAREVLNEMLADANLASLPEMEKARELLAKYSGT